MINNNYTKKILIIFTLLLLYVTIVSGQEEKSTDSVLDFYLKRAKSVYNSRNFVKIGAVYSFVARTYQSEFTRNGILDLKDSSIVNYYYSFGELDSQTVVVSTNDKLDSLDFSYPNVFEKDYEFNFFPHDIGGDNISIGIDSDKTRNLSPVGIAVINRKNYILNKLYLYYPGKNKYKQYSKVISLKEFEGIIFPDSIDNTFAKMGIFSSNHFRRLTVIDSFTVSH